MGFEAREGRKRLEGVVDKCLGGKGVRGNRGKEVLSKGCLESCMNEVLEENKESLRRRWRRGLLLIW